MLLSSRFPVAPFLSQALRSASPSMPGWRREEDRFVLEVLAAGLSPDQIAVRQEGRGLEVVLGQRGVLHARLPQAADTQSLSATLSRGILTLTLAVQPASLPKTIAVQELTDTVAVDPPSSAE